MSENLLQVKDLKVWFKKRKNIKTLLKKDQYIKAVDGISFNIKKGEVFGIIGESGCGKSTLAKTIMNLCKAKEGAIYFEEKNIINQSRKKQKELKRKIQMIFQDPYSAINPSFDIYKVLEEPILIHKTIKSKQDRRNNIIEKLENVKLNPAKTYLNRYPHQLSGGQRQRIVTARALMLGPKFLIADEPVSMIDLSTKAEILTMFNDLKEKYELTYLYITHDLSTARYFTDRIAVMYLGKIVELGKPKDIIEAPCHPYTKALIKAVCDPSPKDTNEIKDLPIKGEISSAESIPSGCRFHPRCLYANDKCKTIEPMTIKKENGHEVACHLCEEAD